MGLGIYTQANSVDTHTRSSSEKKHWRKVAGSFVRSVFCFVFYLKTMKNVYKMPKDFIGMLALVRRGWDLASKGLGC